FCRSTRGVAMQHGYRASFMSKPYLDAPGSGMHVHVSLYDEAGRNLLDGDGQRPLRNAVAGCLELLPHCMPIFAANHNAYRRYGSRVNAASQASWGFEDRDACIRIPESDGRNLRIEHRLAGADANPYLVLAAILSGMEYGPEQAREPTPSPNEDRSSGIDLPKARPRSDANPYLVLAAILSGMEYGLEQAREPIPSLNEDRSSGIDFPKDMLSAVAALENHAVMQDKLGREFVFVYCENKRHDHLDFMNE